MDICPKCKINFDRLHKMCSSISYSKYLLVRIDSLWKSLGKANINVDLLRCQVDELATEIAELRLKKDSVETTIVKHMLSQGEGSLGLSKAEAEQYCGGRHLGVKSDD